MKNKILKKLIIWLFALIGVIIAILLIYMCIPHNANATSLNVLQNPPSNISIVHKDDKIVSKSANVDAKVGILFFPGAKVNPEAYALFYEKLAQNNIMCVAKDSLFHFAYADFNLSNKIFDEYPSVTTWYVAGHSLGGAKADDFAIENSDKVRGVINLASHLRTDLSKTNLRYLGIYASEDKIAKYSDAPNYENNLPADSCIKLIEGGCHAYFGDYGFQLGDGDPSISQEEQNNLISKYTIDFINSK